MAAIVVTFVGHAEELGLQRCLSSTHSLTVVKPQFSMSSRQPETDTCAGPPQHHLLAILCRAGKAASKGLQQQLSALWSLRDPLRRPTCALLADLVVTLLEQSEGTALRELLANRWADPHRGTGSQHCTPAAHCWRVSRVQPTLTSKRPGNEHACAKPIRVHPAG